jgi:hypothetical protein
VKDKKGNASVLFFVDVISIKKKIDEEKFFYAKQIMYFLSSQEIFSKVLLPKNQFLLPAVVSCYNWNDFYKSVKKICEDKKILVPNRLFK